MTPGLAVRPAIYAILAEIVSTKYDEVSGRVAETIVPFHTDVLIVKNSNR